VFETFANLGHAADKIDKDTPWVNITNSIGGAFFMVAFFKEKDQFHFIGT
jgi:hypothetical protein